MQKMTFALATKSCCTIAVLFGLTACEQALVYGDRSGFNLAIRSDAAEGAPLEVNAGLQRRVVGFVPPRSRTPDGLPDSEAVNMVSRFDLRRTPGDNGPFDDTIRISTSFASGAAASATDGDAAKVAAITRAPNFALSDDPDARSVAGQLFDYVGQSTPHANAYLSLAMVEKLQISDGATPTARAIGTITNPSNAAGNKRIAEAL